MLREIAAIILDLSGNDSLYFDTALIIKLNPHDVFQVLLWAACVDPEGNVWVMNGMEEWSKVEEKDTVVIQSLYQRVQAINQKYKTA